MRILLVIAGPLFTRQRHDAHRPLFGSYLPHSFDWQIARIRSTSSSERLGRPALFHFRNAAAYRFASSQVMPRTSAASWASDGFWIPLPLQAPVGGRSPSRRIFRVMPQTEHFHRGRSVGSSWNLHGIILAVHRRDEGRRIAEVRRWNDPFEVAASVPIDKSVPASSVPVVFLIADHRAVEINDAPHWIR